MGVSFRTLDSFFRVLPNCLLSKTFTIITLHSGKGFAIFSFAWAWYFLMVSQIPLRVFWLQASVHICSSLVWKLPSSSDRPANLEAVLWGGQSSQCTQRFQAISLSPGDQQCWHCMLKHSVLLLTMSSYRLSEVRAAAAADVALYVHWITWFLTPLCYLEEGHFLSCTEYSTCRVVVENSNLVSEWGLVQGPGWMEIKSFSQSEHFSEQFSFHCICSDFSFPNSISFKRIIRTYVTLIA